ncbi:MAG: hypothetical protein ACI8Z1_002995 [Candidatus Azotimanducaceae bacterium]|jgi:hypothetical protein
MRRLWINIHLFLAAFFLLPLIMMGTSGGLYLLGIKGAVEKTPVALSAAMAIDPSSTTLADDIREILAANNIDHKFEYINTSGSTLITRPTSRTHYEFNLAKAEMSRAEPDLVKTMIELHKGHGPRLFKDLQKVMALGLLFVLLSGFWLGVSATGLRTQTLITTALGGIVFVLLAFLL